MASRDNSYSKEDEVSVTKHDVQYPEDITILLYYHDNCILRIILIILEPSECLKSLRVPSPLYELNLSYQGKRTTKFSEGVSRRKVVGYRNLFFKEKYKK